MSFKASTGFISSVLATGSVKALLDTMIFQVYSGAVPTSADAASTGTAAVLWTIKDGTDVLTWTLNTSVSPPVLEKASTDTWSGATAAGTATYFRILGTADTEGSSTSLPRLQGEVGATLSTATDLYVSSTTFTTGTKTLASFSVSIPLA